MADYQNVPYKLWNKGLNFSVPPDVIAEHQYTRLTNVRSVQEGQLLSRFGLAKSPWSTNCGWIIFMAKLEEGVYIFILSTGEVFVNGSPLLIYDSVAGVGDRTGTSADPNPTEGNLAWFPLTLREASVDKISLVKFTNSGTGEDWFFLGTEDGMWKINPKLDPNRAWKWGIRPPKKATTVGDNTTYDPVPLTTAVQACPPDSAGHYGCGLDAVSNNRTAYKWVYTYVNSRTGGESNPSDEMATGVDNLQPTVYNDNGSLSKQGQSVKLTGFVKPTDPQVDRLRIYRLGGGLNDYFLEQEVPWDTTEFVSFRSDGAIESSTLLSFLNDVPFTSLMPTTALEELPPEERPPAEYPEKDDEFGVIKPVSLFETPMGRCWGPFAGQYIFAAGDKFRPSVLYWTNAGQPDGAGDDNEVQVCSNSEPIQNGFVFGGNCFVFTKDNLYALDWGGPTSDIAFTPRLVPQGMGLSAPEAFAVGTQGVFFLSKDGVYLTDCTSFCESITHDSLKPIFLGKTASVGDVDVEQPEFYPVNWERISEIYMVVAAQELHFVYWAELPPIDIVAMTGNPPRESHVHRRQPDQRVHLVYDILQKRWQRFQAAGDLQTAYVYADPNESKYLVHMALSDGAIYFVTDGADDISDIGHKELIFEDGDQVVGPDSEPEDFYDIVPFHVQARTGAGDVGQPLTHKEFGVIMVDANTYGHDMTITPLYDNETVTGESFLMNTTVREVKTFSLGDAYHKNLTLDFQWDGKGAIYQVTLLTRIDEEEIVHWEHPDTSMQIPGWKHIRDMYIGMRSTGDVRLRIEVDGVAFDYFLPSTEGERRKVYVKLIPTKGKVFRFFLDSIYDVIEQQGDTVHYENPPFRMYGDDSYYYVKPWHTGNSYTKVKLGGSGGAF